MQLADLGAARQEGGLVLHAFMKKSKSGIALPKPDAELIEARLKRARVLDAED
jgi:phage-related protein